MNQTNIFLATASLAVLSCSLGPGRDKNVLIDEQFPSSVFTFTLPESTAVGDSVAVFLAGEAGCDGSYHFERIDQHLEGMRWSLAPIVHHLVRRDEAYVQMMPRWAMTVKLHASAVGWIHVEVTSAQGRLVDSTQVFVPPGLDRR